MTMLPSCQIPLGRSALLACIALLSLGCLSAASSRAADEQARGEERAAYIRSHYAKFEYRIPMRDGKRLFTSVYVPNDRSESYPILLVRTPYTVAPYGLDRYRPQLGPMEAFEKDGFIFVFQDVRGRFMSEGEFVNMRPHEPPADEPQINESTDTYDTIDWLVKNLPNNNGRVGQWGISYPGFYTSAGAIDSHPALKAVSPQAPIADWWFDDMHHHGAFILPLTFNFFSVFGQERPDPTTKWPDQFEHGTPDGYRFFLDLGPLKNANERYLKGDIAFWNELIAHPNYDDFWQSRNILPHLKSIKAAVLVVGGWFDTEDLYGPLNTYASIEQQNPGIDNHLVMGPWSHGQWASPDGAEGLGSADWGFDTAELYNESILLPFFRHHLKDGDAPALAEVTAFETGANRWRRFDAWPPKAAQPASLYLAAGGRLQPEPPAAEAGVDRFVSDPAKPVPYTAEVTSDWAKHYMTEDQRFSATRTDVLVYESEPLEEDLTLAGAIDAELFVATSESAADWIVKVIDVWPGELPGTVNRDFENEAKANYPGGRQQLVRAEVLRGRFRNSYETPEPFVANEVTPLTVKLNDTFHTFKRGHRIMVHVQSTWFPFVDRNPQRYVPNIFEADADDFVKATHSVFRQSGAASRIRFRVLPQQP